jgi:2-oxoglutarate dehydrogenase E2 component (dihydrolipoamide succinyltransferase)
MATEILVPELGESVLEATVSRWLKKEGDRIEQGEVLVELETDKVNLEVGATESGVIDRILHREGEDVKVGDVLATLELAPKEGPKVETATPAKQVAPGHKKASNGADQSEFQAKASSREKVPEEPVEYQTAVPALKATPIANRIAHEEGIDLEQVRGTGPGGRATKSDVLSYLEEKGGTAIAPEVTKPQAASPLPVRAEEEPPLPKEAPADIFQASFDRREERVKMSRRRRTIAQRLVETQHTVAMLTTFNEVDMSSVMDLRKRTNDDNLARYGVKIGITAFFAKAVVAALKAFPRLNTELDGEELVIKHHYDIGIAVGDEEGLVVPVLRNADALSLVDIEKGIGALARKVKDKTLEIDDLRGGTFSITNGGVFGSLLSTPILNGPEVGILGLHKIEERPIAVEGRVMIRPMMYVALSYDHRVVDGREAVQFLVKVKELIENPERMLIEG